MITLEQIWTLLKHKDDILKLIKDGIVLADDVQKIAPEITPIINDISAKTGAPKETVIKKIYAPATLTEDENKWFDSQNDDM